MGTTGKKWVGLWAFAFVATAWVPVHASQPGGRSAVAFSAPVQDPSLRPPGWVDKPIRYGPRARDVDLAIALDQQQYPAVGPLIQAFAGKHAIRVSVSDGTCGISAGLLARKAVDIGGYCCPPGSTDRLPGLRFHTLGISAIALIAHPDNPVDDVSIEQARGLFSGEIQQWSELESIRGGDNSTRPVGRLHCKHRPGHWRLLLENEDQFSPSLLEVGSIPDMIAQVSSSPLAIGYETLWMVHLNRDRGNVKLLSVDGVQPGDREALVAGRYPLYRTYSVTTWEGAAANPLAMQLVDYLKDSLASLDPAYQMIPSTELRKRGWRFLGDELIGEPGPVADNAAQR